MSTPMKFHEYQEETRIPAGRITRHPRIQRQAPGAERWKKNCGNFSLAKADLAGGVVLVRREDDPNTFYAIDGATRAEACNRDAKYGPTTPMKATILGNGTPPSDQELAEAFVFLNDDSTQVAGKTVLTLSATAKRPSAVRAQRLLTLLGPSFQGYVGVWRMIENGYDMEQAVDEARTIWGPDVLLPMNILRAIGVILSTPQDARQLRKRRKVLAARTPETWQADARVKHLRTVGKRPSIGVFMVNQLLGKRG